MINKKKMLEKHKLTVSSYNYLNQHYLKQKMSLACFIEHLAFNPNIKLKVKDKLRNICLPNSSIGINS